MSPGTYTLTVTATQGTQTRSATATITLVAADLANVKVYPNPWRSDKHAGRDIRFDGLTVGTTIKLFTAGGRLIKEAHTDSSSWTWNRTNDSGDAVASGVYLYVITDTAGDKVRGKVAVVK